MALLSTMATFWLVMFVVFVMINRGIWVFTDVSKSMSMFMLEKALGPAVDFVEGRDGSGAKTWIMQGALWLVPSSFLTFSGLWLAHEPTALNSLASWGYSPSSEELILAGNLTAFHGAVAMLLIGAGMHIVPKLGGTSLASERNATLMSFVWTFSVFIMMIGAHSPQLLGIKVLFVGTMVQSLVAIAVIINQLLTASSRTRKMPLPAWLIIIGLISYPIALSVVAISGELETGLGQWTLVRMVGGAFFFMQVAGVSLYAASIGTGNQLWSRSLSAVILMGAIFTLNPLGDTTGSIAAGLLGIDHSTLEASNTDVIAGSFLMALAAIPIIALSSNILVTMRGDDVFVENPDYPGMPEINLGGLMLLPLCIGALFVQTDSLTGTNELVGISGTMLLMVAWLLMVPLSLGPALAIFPEVSGRSLLSNIRSRWAFWMMAGGAFSGLLMTLMADFSEMALLELDPESGLDGISKEIRVIGSVLFYGTVIGAILHCLNIISGTFRGSILGGKQSESSTSIIQESFQLTSGTTVRKILASGANLDTEVIPTAQTDKPGSHSEL